MRLGVKLSLAFLAVALIPAGGILFSTWSSLAERFDEEHQRRLDGIHAGLLDEVARMGERLQAKLQALGETEEVERILVDMVRGQLDRRALVPRAAAWMRTYELDLLSLLDSGGTVLSCGHLPARYGGVDPASVSLASEESPRPQVIPAQVLRQGTIREVLAIALGHRRRFNEAEVLVVGGTILDEGFATHLEKLSGAAIRIVDAAGKPVALGASAGQVGPGAWQAGPGMRRVALSSAFVEVSVSRAELEAAQQRFAIASALAAGASVLLSFLLGLVWARRITRPVQALVGGARAVARGELESRVEGTYQAEMGELVRAFNRMMEELSTYQRRLIRAERVAAWQEIARRIAHEIKNPLSPIQVSIETMRKAYSSNHPDFAEIFEESTQAIQEEVAALKRIVTEFSEFARMPKPSPVRQPLHPVVECAVSLYRNQAAGVELLYEPAAELPELPIDREQLGRVLGNVLTNAVQAITPPGRVVVSTAREGDGVVIRISDTGRGMSPEVLAKVFTPYFTTRQDGTGLGLAIVQRILEEHGGNIEIESQVGRGSVVSILLPLESPADHPSTS
ncbi:MAG TPA: ATP-binding protein [Myxococcota bacterium]|nr:ATP-binding protein [Myxococcota bacterium]HRY95422.1 ATP-binding protein [Myxococcota bacterium]HSA23448.1 ATP-binding protein [Myxococcota bacterium]